MALQLTKTQLSQVLAGLSGTEPRVVLKYLENGTVRRTIAERIQLAQRTWADMVAAYAARARREGGEHGSS